MNRSELIHAVAERTGKSKTEAAIIVDATFGIIADCLNNTKETVSIADFGRFYIKYQSERNGINPQTGEKITIEAKEKISFKAASSMEYYSRKHN